ncbi:MAG TPA: hypothetical protein VEW46_17305 [Pyrinomonadaceae bacterium]|nr:hypothetical protein [Pyrinomonadaceae bacterium]
MGRRKRNIVSKEDGVKKYRNPGKENGEWNNHGPGMIVHNGQEKKWY